MKIFLRFVALGAMLILILGACEKKEGGTDKNMEDVKKMEKQYSDFSKAVQEKLSRAYTDMALAYWNASVSGKDEDFKKSAEFEIVMNNLLANKADFDSLKKYKESGLIQDELLKRELQMLYNGFLANQVDTAKLKAMTELQSEITKKYQNFRATVGSKQLTDNDVEQILKTSKDSKKLEETWMAHKKIGPVVAEDIIKLVKMRNEVAKELGFKNYHDMSLRLSDQDPEEISKLFDELDELTRETFRQLKVEIDNVISTQCKIKPEDLKPWHYQNRYFQEAPKIYDIELDNYYKDKDVVELTKAYYKSIGMEISELIAKSDLYEKPGKNQHAFCTDIDRKVGDVRVLCNVKNNYDWMNTMLHEFGHAVYFKYQDHKLPWILDQPAHTFTTEAIAMLFGRMASNPQWLQDMAGISKEEKEKIAGTAFKILRLEQLVFSRWAQVMYRFEKSMYENPDQDLNKLWWDIVEKYQMIKRPEGRNMPDWATKIHIATSPCYYHNYLLGELLASQLYTYMNEKLLKNAPGTQTSFKDMQEAGKYLTEKVFMPAARYSWNDMIEKATGEKLTAKYYAAQFVK